MVQLGNIHESGSATCLKYRIIIVMMKTLAFYFDLKFNSVQKSLAQPKTTNAQIMIRLIKCVDKFSQNLMYAMHITRLKIIN